MVLSVPQSIVVAHCRHEYYPSNRSIVFCIFGWRLSFHGVVGFLSKLVRVLCHVDNFLYFIELCGFESLQHDDWVSWNLPGIFAECTRRQYFDQPILVAKPIFTNAVLKVLLVCFQELVDGLVAPYHILSLRFATPPVFHFPS